MVANDKFERGGDFGWQLVSIPRDFLFKSNCYCKFIVREVNLMLDTTILEALVKLPDSLKQEVLHYIEFLLTKYENNEALIDPFQKKRQAGMMKGTFVLPLSDDFDAPLEDFQEYM
jgi:Protein of unknown function (DUF2281)